MSKAIIQQMQSHGELAQLADGPVRYELSGPEDGEFVMMVHGLAGHYHIWDRNFEAFVKAGFRVLRLDLYGRGFSERITEPHTSELYVRQLSGLMEHLKITAPITLMGLSMGGAVISHFAKAFPEKVKRMIFVDPYGIATPNDPIALLMRPRLIGEGVIYIFGHQFIRLAAMNGMKERTKARKFSKWFVAPMKLSGSKRALLACLRHFMLEDHASVLKEVNELNIPKMLVWGRHDRVLKPEYGERVGAILSSAEFHWFEECGHLPNFEAPEKFNSLCFSFIERTTPD